MGRQCVKFPTLRIALAHVTYCFERDPCSHAGFREDHGQGLASEGLVGLVARLQPRLDIARCLQHGQQFLPAEIINVQEVVSFLGWSGGLPFPALNWRSSCSHDRERSAMGDANLGVPRTPNLLKCAASEDGRHLSHSHGRHRHAEINANVDWCRRGSDLEGDLERPSPTQHKPGLELAV
jgi:hypothetical protein